MSLDASVSALLRHVATTAILPRFRRLAAADVVEKRPGELVTTADREAELRLRDGLAALGLGARIVGEEAADADPTLIDGIGGGLVWLVDPLDGTANFAAGRGPFGLMIALVEDGIPRAGWMFDPLRDRMCHAERGGGATIDGERVRTRARTEQPLVAALGTQFLVPAQRTRVHARADAHFTRVPIPRCAAESYPRLVLGADDIALFQRILPWDHAAGALFVEEAGGRVTHWDGTPYRVGSGRPGLLAAANRAAWEEAARVLLCAETGLVEDEALAA